MLRFGILLLAASALAAPQGDLYEVVDLTLIPYNEIGIAQNIGRANHLTDGLFSMKDGADLTVNSITMRDIINDMASQNDGYSQGLALGQSFADAGVLSTGSPGDACLYADFINAYVSGNYRRELKNLVNLIVQNLDRLAKQKLNPQSARYSVGARSGCNGGGRTYQFEPAWEVIIANASPSAARYINEEYCTVKRLYYSFDISSNIQAAAVTATSLPPMASIMSSSQGPLSNFAAALVSNTNITPALQAAKQSLLQCLL